MREPHPKAKLALNKRAEELLLKVRRFPSEDSKPNAPRFQPNIAISACFGEADIKGPIVLEEIDTESNRIVKIAFQAGHSMAGLKGEECDLFDALATETLQCGNISLLVSDNTIRRIIREWLRLRFEQQTDFDFFDALKKDVENAVAPIEALIPICMLEYPVRF